MKRQTEFKIGISLSLILTLTLSVIFCHGAKIAMKVVESPVAYSFNNDLISPASNQETLVLQVQAQNFTGPGHLRQLVGRCYNYSDDLYHYVFCPFQNVTQHEISNRWNAYQGVLGVWQEWKIINNSFQSMMMLYGDYCGVLQRSAEVFLECGSAEQVKDVTEPSKCHYRMIFETQLTCHPDSMLVYPWLSTSLQRKWDELETDLANEDITPKGYRQGLRAVFLEAKFYATNPQSPKVSVNSGNVTSIVGKEMTHSQCLQEVADLRREIEALKVLLELNAITDKKEN